MIGSGDLKNTKEAFLYIILMSLLIAIGVSLVVDSEQKKSIYQQIDQDLSLSLANSSSNINQKIASYADQVHFLANTPPIMGIVRASLNDGFDSVENSSFQTWSDRLQRIFVEYIRTSPDIYQIRYIAVANNGQELVRVEKKSNSIEITPVDKLQQKGGRTYFEETLKLPPNIPYISDVTLNQENGRLDIPHRPTIRIAYPVYQPNGHVFGMVVINVNAQVIFQYLQKSLAKNVTLFVINNHKDFILHPDPEKTFGTDISTAYSFDQEFSSLNKIAGFNNLVSAESAFNKEGYIVKIKNIELNQFERRDLVLRFVGAISNAYVNRLVTKNRVYSFFAIIFFVLMITALSFYSFRNIQRQRLDNDKLSIYESIFDSSIDSILTLDHTGRIIDCNYSAQKLLAMPKQFLLDRYLSDIFPSTSYFTNKQKTEETLITKENQIITFFYDTEQGRRYYLEVSLFAIRREIGEVFYGCLLHDVTDARLAEHAIQLANQDLESKIENRTRELVIAKDQALAANKTISAFVTNVSHELRTPINGIMGMLKLIQGQVRDPSEQNYVHMAQRSASTLLVLVNDILDISKIEAGKLELEKAEFNLQELISLLSGSMSVLINDKPVDLVVDIADLDIIYVKGDSHRIKQILTNLISNAIKFTVEGTIQIIAMSRREENDRIRFVVTIKDTGTGISAEVLPQLFQKFTQADNSTTRRFGGTGLGLTISRELAHLMGGDITVVSSEESGSEFRMELVLDASTIAAPDVGSKLAEEGLRQLWVLDHDDLNWHAVSHQMDAWGITCVRLTTDLSELNQLSIEQNPMVLVSYTHWLEHRNSVDQLRAVFNGPFPVIITHRSDQLVELPEDWAAPLHLMALPVTPMSFLNVFGIYSSPNEDVEQKQKDENELALMRTAKQVLDGKHVLIVDDNEINIAVAKGFLEGFDIQFSLAVNGMEALSILESSADLVDIVLMDCQMPVMDGYEATEAIRRGDAGKVASELPIVAMTANAMSGDRDKCLNVGMNEYLPKPLDQDKLINLLARILGSVQTNMEPVSSESNKDQLLMPELVWDMSSALVRLGGNEGLLQRLISLFLKSYEAKVAELSVAVHANKVAKIRFCAHSLKGSSAAIGLERIRAVCLSLEIDNENGSNANSKRLQQLEMEVGSAVSLLKQYMQEKEVSNNEPTVPQRES